jgi:serine/threonine protein kinase
LRERDDLGPAFDPPRSDAGTPRIGYRRPTLVASLAAVNLEEEQKPTLPEGEILHDEVDGTRFQVADLIGRGGMGEVYRATKLRDGARCAIKCVRRDLAQSPTVLLRTRFEAKAFRMINHPNVVRVLGTGVWRDNLPWMAMEWLEGFTLAQIIELRGRIPVPFAIRIVRDLCQGLRAIHPHAIHRDIKPSNAHLGLDCVTRALDLGAAKSKDANLHLTTTGFQVGTLPFMAPEQLDNTLPIDHRADLWAATVLLYLLITGVHPFAIDGALPASKIKLGWTILTEPHRPLLDALPHAPRFCGQIIDRGLAKDPANRHRSAEELVQVLTLALEHLENMTGHAEPLSSLVDDLRGSAAPIVAVPPRLLWVPRTTEPMPPPLPKSHPASPRALVHVPWVSPRTTEPMPPPIPRGAPEPTDDASDHGVPALRASDVRLKRVLPHREAASEPAPRAPAGARRWLGAARWLAVLVSAGAVVTTAELVYFLGRRHGVEPTRPAVVVAGFGGEPAGGAAPAPTSSTGEPEEDPPAGFGGEPAAGPAPTPAGSAGTLATGPASAPAMTAAPAVPSAAAVAVRAPPPPRPIPAPHPHVLAVPIVPSARGPLFRSNP